MEKNNEHAGSGYTICKYGKIKNALSQEQNYVFLMMGRIARDVSYKPASDAKKAWAATSFAVNTNVFKLWEMISGETIEAPETHFLSINAFGVMADYLSTFSKGSYVGITGCVEIIDQADKNGNISKQMKITLDNIAPADGSRGKYFACKTKVFDKHENKIICGITGEIAKVYDIKPNKKYGDVLTLSVKCDQFIDKAFAVANGVHKADNVYENKYCFVQIQNAKNNGKIEKLSELLCPGRRVVIAGKPRVSEVSDKTFYYLDVKGAGTEIALAYLPKQDASSRVDGDGDAGGATSAADPCNSAEEYDLPF